MCVAQIVKIILSCYRKWYAVIIINVDVTCQLSWLRLQAYGKFVLDLCKMQHDYCGIKTHGSELRSQEESSYCSGHPKWTQDSLHMHILRAALN